MKYTVRRIREFLLGISLFAAALAAWQLLTALKAIPPWMLSPPTESLSTLWRLLWSGTLFELLLNSLANMLPAFCLSVVLSLALGVAIGMNSVVRRMFMPFLAAVNSVPSLAWLPLLIMMFGFTRQTIWTVIFISSFTKMIYSVIGGVRGIDRNWLLAARNLGLGRLRTIFKIVLPGALPQILGGVRLGFGSAWRSLIGAEMLVVTAGGLGKYIWMSQWASKFDQVLAGIIVIAFVGVLTEQLVFRKIEKVTLIRWGSVDG